MLVFIHREISGEVYSLLESIDSILPSIHLLQVFPHLRCLVLVCLTKRSSALDLLNYLHDDIVQLYYFFRECFDRLLVGSHFLYLPDPVISNWYTLEVASQSYVP